jgi:hypothetical protein
MPAREATPPPRATRRTGSDLPDLPGARKQGKAALSKAAFPFMTLAPVSDPGLYKFAINWWHRRLACAGAG